MPSATNSLSLTMRRALAQWFAAALPGIEVTRSLPNEPASDRVIVLPDPEPAQAVERYLGHDGRARRDYDCSVLVLIEVFRPGPGQDAAEDAAEALLHAIEDVIATAPTLDDTVPGLLIVGATSSTVEHPASDLGGQWYVLIEHRITVEARLD